MEKLENVQLWDGDNQPPHQVRQATDSVRIIVHLFRCFLLPPWRNKVYIIILCNFVKKTSHWLVFKIRHVYDTTLY